MVDFETVRRLALALPGVEEGHWYGTPSFRTGKIYFARLRPDGENLVLRVGHLDRDALLAARPDICHITPHYEGSEMVLVRLPQVDADDLQELLETSLRYSTPRASPRASRRRA